MNEECCVHEYLKLPLTLNSCHVKFLYWAMMCDDTMDCMAMVYIWFNVCAISCHSIGPPSVKVWTLVTATFYERRIVFVS